MAATPGNGGQEKGALGFTSVKQTEKPEVLVTVNEELLRNPNLKLNEDEERKL